MLLSSRDLRLLCELLAIMLLLILLLRRNMVIESK